MIDRNSTNRDPESIIEVLENKLIELEEKSPCNVITENTTNSAASKKRNMSAEVTRNGGLADDSEGVQKIRKKKETASQIN